MADLRSAAPDLVLHGGDLADGGSSPTQVVDWIRELGWAGVMGNTDEMLVRAEALEDFAGQSKAPARMWTRSGRLRRRRGRRWGKNGWRGCGGFRSR